MALCFTLKVYNLNCLIAIVFLIIQQFEQFELEASATPF